MPRPTDTRVRYLPGLDGIRGLAVIAVILYHLEIPGMTGGLLGVGIFFTLSGYLITSILLRSWERTGGLELRTFWLKRARRLLPAVVAVLFSVVVVTALVAPEKLRATGREALAALGYVHNWFTIASGQSYFQRFTARSPLDHLWSLAVEEQFYLVWPLLLLLLLRLAKGRRTRLIGAMLVLASVSFLLLWVCYAPGFDNTRSYEGTDTRAGGLLVGAALAVVWNGSALTRRLRTAGRIGLETAGFASLAVIGWLVATTDEYSATLYSWGLLTLTLATTALTAAAVHPATWLGRMLSVRPLVWTGERSYGIYLWHLPILAGTPESVLAEAPIVRGALQVALSLAVAELSWRFLEDPVRRNGFREAFAMAFNPTRRGYAATVTSATAAVLVLGVGTNAVVAATHSEAPAVSAASFAGGASGLEPPLPDPEPEAEEPRSVEGPANPSVRAPEGGRADPPRPLLTPVPQPTTAVAPAPAIPGSTPVAPAKADIPPGAVQKPVTPSTATTGSDLRTTCSSVVHVGDSTSVGLVAPAYLPKEPDRIPAQYASVGVVRFHDEISGARSIVEKVNGVPNAQEVVATYPTSRYKGCFVIAMGTNDPANQYVGGGYPLPTRIDLMMKLTAGRPTLWLTSKTLRSSGPYGNAEMLQWNEAVTAACQRYSNLRVYDWAGEVRTSWFINDGIHYTRPGYRERANRIARGLATAFPATGGTAPACLVGSGR